MDKIYVGIDNGVSGTIGVVYPDGDSEFLKVPVIKEQNYTKKKGNVTRINAEKLFNFLSSLTEINKSWEHLFCAIERPMVNPTRFAATTSALRALEATLIIVELLNIPYMYIDSKEWQKELLPSGCKGEELKTASRDIGCRLFPKYKDLIIKHKDADGILIAEYLRRNSF